MIDLIALGNSEKLKSVLTRIFLDEATLKVGLALRGDLTRVRKACNLDKGFADRMLGYVDLGLLHQDLEAFRADPKTFNKVVQERSKS